MLFNTTCNLFVSSGLSSETNVITPNTESSWDFKTRSTNDDGTSLDLEWEDEEGGGLSNYFTYCPLWDVLLVAFHEFALHSLNLYCLHCAVLLNNDSNCQIQPSKTTS